MKLLKINAMWCPSCLIMNNVYEKIAGEFKLELESLDYDFDSEKVSKLNIGKILPVLIIYNDEIEVTRIVGEKKYHEVKNIIEEVLNENN